MSSATQPNFGQDSWQTPRNARTLRTFMALQNQEIAARIRELRGSRPQTFVADEMGVSERTLQNWEAGSSKPSYRSLQAIAKYYEVPEEFILTGGRRSLARSSSSETPDILPATVTLSDLEERLTRIEDKLDRIVRHLNEASVDQDRRIAAVVERAGQALQSAKSDYPQAAAKPAPKRSRPASSRGHA